VLALGDKGGEINLTEAERNASRKHRFGKLGGDVTTLAAAEELEEEKQKNTARAHRFGLATKVEEEEKKKERAERLGMGKPQATRGGADDDRRQQRAPRFGLPDNAKEAG
jgi:hypothetical protein